MKQDKIVAVLAYIGPIGWILGWIFNNNQPSGFGRFHLRQAAGLYIFSFLLNLALSASMLIPVLNALASLLYPLLGLGLFILWLIGIIRAISGEAIILPVIGRTIEDKLGKFF